MTEYIDKEALRRFPIRLNHYDKEHGNEHFVLGIESVLEYAESLPSADVEEVRHGKWVPILAINGHTYYDCSVCGRQVDTIRKQNPTKIFPYCHCGAKMGGKDE